VVGFLVFVGFKLVSKKKLRLFGYVLLAIDLPKKLLWSEK
jgi:hypothetical protein